MSRHLDSNLSRRSFLQQAGGGIGMVALATMLERQRGRCAAD